MVVVNGESRKPCIVFRGQTCHVDPKWVDRRRIARAAFVYVLLGAMAVLVMAPLLYAALSSFKANPLEWPPSLVIPRLQPSNWAAAWNLGIQGGGDGWTGGWAPGRSLSFEAVFLYPAELDLPPRVHLLAPLGRGLHRPPDPRPATEVQIFLVGEQSVPQGREMRFQVVLNHHGNEDFPVLRMAIAGPRGTKFLRATLAPSTVRGLGTTAHWDNLTAGVIGYVFTYFIKAWTEFQTRDGEFLFPRWIWNSFFIAVLRVVVTAIFATMAGYALARLRFPGKNFLFFLVIFTMMVPVQVTFISNFILLRDGIFGISRLFGRENLLNTYWAMFLPMLTGGFAVVLMKQFLESIPREIEEAARIDGAGTFRIYTRIILPLCLPAVAVLSILTFQGSWNEFFWPLIVLRDTEMFTLPIGLLFFREFFGAAGGAHWNLILAGTVFSAIPVLVIFLLFQRYFVKGFHMSGIKQ